MPNRPQRPTTAPTPQHTTTPPNPAENTPTPALHSPTATNLKKAGRKKIWKGKKKENAQKEIIERLTNGETLESICKSDHLPEPKCVYDWLWSEDDQENGTKFGHAYIRARKAQGELAVDKAFKLGQDLATKPGEYDRDAAQVARAALQSLHWHASHVNPAYSDTLRHTGHDGGPIQVKHSLEAAIHKAKAHRERLASDAIDVTPDRTSEEDS